MKLKILAVALAALPVLTLSSFAADPDPTKNILRNGDVEVYSDGAVPQEDMNTFWAPVSKENMDKNTFFNVVSTKAHGGKKSIHLALTPDTMPIWKQHPGKEGTDGLFLHYTVKPKTDLKALAAERIVFIVWVYVEKGPFIAHFRARGNKDKERVDLFKGDIDVEETGKWVEVKLEGRGVEGLTRTDVRLEMDCQGTFDAYLDDFYYGPAPEK